jgi:hypothetical protein
MLNCTGRPRTLLSRQLFNRQTSGFYSGVFRVGICGGQSGTGTCICTSASVFPYQLSFQQSYSVIRHPGGLSVGPQRHIISPHYESRKKVQQCNAFQCFWYWDYIKTRSFKSLKQFSKCWEFRWVCVVQSSAMLRALTYRAKTLELGGSENLMRVKQLAVVECFSPLEG